MVLVFKDTILTNKGFDVSNQAALGQTQFSIFKAVSTDQDLTNYKIEDLKNLTSLPGEIDSGTITDSDNPQNSISVINLTFDNSEFKQGYTIRAIGLYGKDSSGNVFLHSLTVSDTPVVVPEVSGNIFDGVKHSISIFSGNNKNMNVNIQESGSATVKYVNDSISKLSDDIQNIIKPSLATKADKSEVAEGIDNLSGQSKQGFDNLGGMLNTLLDVDEIKRDVSNRFIDYDKGLKSKQDDVSLSVKDSKLYYAGTPVLIANAPNQPQLDLSINKDTGNLAFQITPPVLNGGADITSYNVYYKLATDNEWQSKQLDSNVLYTEVSDLQKSQVYQGKVVANNYSGKSVDSDVKSVVTAKEPSGINLTVNTTLEGYKCIVDVDSDGGANINKYEIFYKSSNSNVWNKIDSNMNSLIMDNLVEGQNYIIKANASNSLGISEDSNVVSKTFSYLLDGFTCKNKEGGSTSVYPGFYPTFPTDNQYMIYCVEIYNNYPPLNNDSTYLNIINYTINGGSNYKSFVVSSGQFVEYTGWNNSGISGDRLFTVAVALDEKGNRTKFHTQVKEIGVNL